MGLVLNLLTGMVIMQLAASSVCGFDAFDSEYSFGGDQGNWLDGLFDFVGDSFGALGDLFQFITLGGLDGCVNPSWLSTLRLFFGTAWLLIAILAIKGGSPA